jgi:hypothetical protein
MVMQTLFYFKDLGYNLVLWTDTVSLVFSVIAQLVLCWIFLSLSKPNRLVSVHVEDFDEYQEWQSHLWN